MFKNYFKIAWRNIFRNKTYSVINTLGLALGVCAAVTIYAVTNYELRFDNFHPDKKRIYQLVGDLTESTGNLLHFYRLPSPVAQAAREGISDLEVVAGIIPYYAEIRISNGDAHAKTFSSAIPGTHYVTAALTEPQYFDIFRYQWLAGAPSADPNTVVLTQNRARDYFGDLHPDGFIGKAVIYNDSLAATVSGIIKDWDGNTDLRFTDFIAYSTIRGPYLKQRFNTTSWDQRDMNSWVFVKLAEGGSPVQVNDRLASLVKQLAGDRIKLAPRLQPLSEVHFNADIIENPIRTAHLPTLYSLMSIAAFILVLAIINFINLSTAQSIMRAREVGVRKVLGGGKNGLIFQFLSETFLLTILAVSIAVALVDPLLRFFGAYIPEGIFFRASDPSMAAFLAGITVVTAIAAGTYPGLVLSSYEPVRTLKGQGISGGNHNRLLRKGLIVFQFTVSMIFLIGSIVVADQLRYTRQKDLGFKADAVINMESPRGQDPDKIDVLAQNIRQIPGIQQVALQWLPPMSDNPRGMKLKYKSTDEKDFWVTQVAGDEEFIPLYQLHLLAGRNLAPSDTVNEFVINETFSRFMGYQQPEEALGRTLFWNDRPYPVVGVVADFHTSSLHNPIEPLCIINRKDRMGSLAVRLDAKSKQSAAIAETLSQMEQVWKRVYPASAFSFSFYQESIAQLYEKDRQAATLVNVSMAVAIFISCIGLFGLSLFNAEKRAREVSIRKILGAGVGHIAILLSREYIGLAVLGLGIAAPIAWYLMHQWLNSFAYRVGIAWWVFAMAGLTAVAIALATVSYQALRTALANPAEVLKAE